MTRIIVCAVLTIAGSCGLAYAQESRLEERFSISLTKAEPRTMFEVVARMLQTDVDVDPGVKTPITITVENVTVKTLLTTICESIGCSWKVDDHVLQVRRDETARVPPSPPVDRSRIRVSRIGSGAAGGVLDSFARMAGLQLQADPALLPRTVTVRLTDVRWPDAMTAVCTEIHCRWSVAEGKLFVNPR